MSLRKRPAASAEQNQKQDVDNEAHVEAMQISQPHVNPLVQSFRKTSQAMKAHFAWSILFFFGGVQWNNSISTCVGMM